MTDYRDEQLGEVWVRPINRKTRGWYSLVVVQPASNDQVLLLEPCDWDAGRKRVVQMVRAGVDPADIRFSWRPGGCLGTDGLTLQQVGLALWWTPQDQRRLDKERDGMEAANVGE